MASRVIAGDYPREKVLLVACSLHPNICISQITFCRHTRIGYLQTITFLQTINVFQKNPVFIGALSD